MERHHQTSRAGALDWAVVATGAGLGVAAVYFRFSRWHSVATLLPHAPADFIVAFEHLITLRQTTLFPLGIVAAMLILIGLMRDGGLESGRGRLRVAALGALFALLVVTGIACDPIERAIIAVADPAATGLDHLVGRWLAWQWVHLGLALVCGASLAAAHRMPVAVVPVTADGLTARHRTLLLLLGAATLFEGYDRFIVTLALPYIGKDLGAGEGTLGWALSAIRLGALFSIVLGRLADRHGRRRILLGSIVAYTVATAATGLSRGVVDFVLYQLFATIFLVTELALAQVVIAEEFPAAWRGRGQGFLGAFAALGAGVAALLFPVLQRTAWGWRGLYLIGLAPLLLITYLWRALPETERWQQARAHDAAHARLVELLRAGYRLRFGVLTLLSFCAAGAGASAGGFLSYRATKTFGWTPGQVSTMILTGGGLGFWGWFMFGRLADAFGRRTTGAVAMIGGAAATVLYYRTAYLLPAMTALVLMESGVAIAINSLGTELFPTRLRATAKAWLTNAGILGAMLGLAGVGALAERLGGAEIVISLLAFLPVLAAPAFYLLPETRRQRLEVIEADATRQGSVSETP